jgi:hypothetical protein
MNVALGLEKVENPYSVAFGDGESWNSTDKSKEALECYLWYEQKRNDPHSSIENK